MPRSPPAPEIPYVRAATADGAEIVVVAAALAEQLLGDDYETLATFPGSELEGARYEAPFDFIAGAEFGPLGHSVLMADFVTTEDGTGLVHTALAFGEDDFRLGEQLRDDAAEPGPPRRHLRRARPRLPGQARPRPQPRDRRRARPPPASSSRRFPTSTPIRTAGAATRR